MPTSPVRAVLEILSRDSRVASGGTEALGFLMDLLYFGDFSVLEQVSSGQSFERVNLIGRKGPRSGPPLVLVANVSTSVEPAPALTTLFDGDRLVTHRSQDRVHGLGANSGKVDAVLKILAGSRYRSDELQRPLIIVALSGEEAHGSGARSIVETLAAPGGKAVVHAPTDERLWTDHPGCISLRLTLNRRIRHRRMPPHAGFFEVRVQGRSAHALSPDVLVPLDGADRWYTRDDALARGLEVLDVLRHHGDVRVLSIAGGEAANRVPGRCLLRVATSFEAMPALPFRDGPSVEANPIADGTALPFPIDGLLGAWITGRDAGIAAIDSRLGHLRNALGARPARSAWTGRVVSGRDDITGSIMLWTGPGIDVDDICERFAQAVQTSLIGQDEIEVQIDVLQERPAFSGSEGAESFISTVRGAMQHARLEPALGAGTFTSDAGLFRAHGFDTVVFGAGGPLEMLYRDDESIGIDRLERTAAFYEQLIRAHCL